MPSAIKELAALIMITLLTGAWGAATAEPPATPAERATEPRTAIPDDSRAADALRAARSRDRLAHSPGPKAPPRPKAKPRPRGWGVAPTKNYWISSGYGHRWGRLHAGLDFAAPAGTPVFAVTTGVVKRASWYGGYGKAVVIDHGAVDTLYGHNSQLLVKAGQRVTRGQVIAKVGTTGHSTGNHLHFEIRKGAGQYDPYPWLLKRGVKL